MSPSEEKQNGQAYLNLGTYSRTVTTSSSDAQVWFDRGLIWLYGYNHEEAIECFKKALEFDADCVMAHWGIAYSIGPNYNKPWDTFEEEEKKESATLAWTHLDAANECANKNETITEVEKDIIMSLRKRYPTIADAPNLKDFTSFNDTYANEMRELYKKHGTDLEVCFLFVASMMNRSPWQLWDLSTGQPAKGADTKELVETLDAVFEDLAADSWKHPGLLHMYIHLMEMSPHPEKALKHGDALSLLVPDSGHLLHMASHIDVLCGDYERVVSRNHQASIADEKYLKLAGPEAAGNFYSIYRCHNYHFKIYGAMFLGQLTPALDACEGLINSLPEDVVRPMADWLEAFIPMKQHVLVRFGKWNDILDQTLPSDQELYCMTTAMMRYARTVALANLGLIQEAEAEREIFFLCKSKVPSSRNLFENTCASILEVASQMMLGELEYHKGNHEVAFDHLRQAVHLTDNLNYDEPWGWMQPVRHALGALLLEQKQFEEAEKVYREDLGLSDTLSRSCQHPNNVWSLHGLHECLKRRGETVEIAHVKLQLDKALARCQVPIKASCFCRGRKLQ